MVLVSVVALLALVPLCAFAPGFYLVRRLRWQPVEKLCGAVGLSLALIYLASFVIFWTGPADGQAHPLPYAAATLLWLILAVASRKDAARLWRAPAVRRAVCGLRVPRGLDVCDGCGHPQLLGRVMGQRLAGTFSAESVFPLSLPCLNGDYEPLHPGSAAAPDEPRRGLLSRTDRRPV